jgi:hypothetical protein
VWRKRRSRAESAGRDLGTCGTAVS